MKENLELIKEIATLKTRKQLESTSCTEEILKDDANKNTLHSYSVYT